jgi:hypothetical protein
MTTGDRRGPRPTPPQPRQDTPPRLFALHRNIDNHGISGTGIVAWGIHWPDGTCAIRWCGTRYASTALYSSLTDLRSVHGHDGRTQVVWLPTATGTPPAALYDVVTARAAHQRYLAADRDQLAHLPGALALAGMLPGLLDAYDVLARAYAAVVAELEQVRAENTAQQEALDVIAAVTDATGGTAP